MKIPQEEELIAFFGSKPDRENELDDLFYDTATFNFENEVELFKLILSPFYDKFILSVKDKVSEETCSYIELRSVQLLEVEADRNQPKVRLFHGESEIYQNVLEFTFVPRFKMSFEEQYR